MATSNPDQTRREWHVVAEMIMLEAYGKMTASEIESACIGLRGFPEDETCAAALEKIDPDKKYRTG